MKKITRIDGPYVQISLSCDYCKHLEWVDCENYKCKVNNIVFPRYLAASCPKWCPKAIDAIKNKTKLHLEKLEV